MLHGSPVFRWWFLGLCLALMPLRPAHAAPELTIMVEDASEPFSRADGTGYANDLVRAAYAAAGVTVHLKVVPYARCKDYLKRALVPACFSMSRDPNNTGIVFSREPLFEVHADIFQKRGARKPLHALADLQPSAAIGIINGYEYPAEIAGLEKRGVTLQRNIDDGTNLKMLAHDRLDAAVLMTSDFDDVGRRLDQGGAREAVALAFHGGLMKSYLAFNLKNPQGRLAQDAFERGYRLISNNREKERIRRRWMGISRGR
jgi:hypothetical protein